MRAKNVLSRHGCNATVCKEQLALKKNVIFFVVSEELLCHVRVLFWLQSKPWITFKLRQWEISADQTDKFVHIIPVVNMWLHLAREKDSRRSCVQETLQWELVLRAFCDQSKFVSGPGNIASLIPRNTTWPMQRTLRDSLGRTRMHQKPKAKPDRGKSLEYTRKNTKLVVGHRPLWQKIKMCSNS